MENRIYAAIDLKSFYASVECMERGLDPLTTNLVVADAERTEKTICLAVSPSLKGYGIPGRPRLFEVIQRLKEVNRERQSKAPERRFTGSSRDADKLKENPSLEIDFIAARPQMAHYIDWSSRIYNVYLKYVSPEDIHVYSIDEVFMDITTYLPASGQSAYDFVKTMLLDVMETTGITAAAGIGTNLYLCKIAMDIVAKHVNADEQGVRIASLDEITYRKLLWEHRPLTDFWRIGRGYAKKLEENGLFTMGDIARCSLGKSNEYHNEDLLYRLFGVNAELLIDHAWGFEPCTIAEVKNYKPDYNCISSGQVLQHPYSYEEARLVVKEMTDLLVLDLVDKGLVTDQVVLTVGYDIVNVDSNDKKQDPECEHQVVVEEEYTGEIKIDHYGRRIPKHAHGTIGLKKWTSSTKVITDAVLELYEQIVNPKLYVRRVNLTANHVISKAEAEEKNSYEQLSLFDMMKADSEELETQEKELEKEEKLQHAVLDIKKRYGKNAILKGMNLQEAATARNRNQQIGGHRA